MNTLIEAVRADLNLPIEKLGVKKSTYNCLSNQNINTVSDLTPLSALDILAFPRAGAGTVEDIRQALKCLTLNLREDPPSDGTLVLQNSSYEVKRALVTRLGDLPLSVRAKNVCEKSGLKYVAELVQLEYSDILRTKNCGAITAAELSGAMRKLNFAHSLRILDWSDGAAEQIAMALSAEHAQHVRDSSGAILSALGPEPMCLEEELQRIARAIAKGRDIEIVLKLWGWIGDEPQTLEAVGNNFGITRERVRQIAANASGKLGGFDFDLSYLKAAIAGLVELAPVTHSQAIAELKKSGITNLDFSPRAVAKAAELFRLEWPFSTIAHFDFKQRVPAHAEALLRNAFPPVPMRREREILVPTETRDALHKIPFIISRITSSAGCMDISSLCSQIGLTNSDIPAVRAFCNALPEIRWLNENREWLYLPASTHNRLFNLVTKVFGVCARIQLRELRSAIARSLRLPTAPPKEILAAMIEDANLGRIVDGIVIAESAAVTLLNPSSPEALMLGVLDRFGPIMERQQFAEKSMAAGVNKATFYVFKSHSPLIKEISEGRYCRVGMEFN